MNIYDFDQTIFDGNSSLNFYLFSLKKYPFLVLKKLFKNILIIIKYPFKLSTTKEVKEKIFGYIKEINDLDIFIEEFVNKNKDKIKPYYINQQRSTDVIITASFDTWIVPLCHKMGIKNIIATKYDIEKCQVIGENNHDVEKVKRFKKEYPSAVVKCAYSDSLHDIPMLQLAEEAFLVKGYNVIKYQPK